MCCLRTFGSVSQESKDHPWSRLQATLRRRLILHSCLKNCEHSRTIDSCRYLTTAYPSTLRLESIILTPPPSLTFWEDLSATPSFIQDGYVFLQRILAPAIAGHQESLPEIFIKLDDLSARSSDPFEEVRAIDFLLCIEIVSPTEKPNNLY